MDVDVELFEKYYRPNDVVVDADAFEFEDDKDSDTNVTDTSSEDDDDECDDLIAGPDSSDDESGDE